MHQPLGPDNLLPERLEKIQRVVRSRQAGFTVVMENVRDPHNIQAVVRTCESLGVQRVGIVFGDQQPYDPKALGRNSSSSANKWIDFDLFATTQQAMAYYTQHEYTTVVTHLDDNAQPITEANLAVPKLALWFGNEKHGISDEAVQLADYSVIIPTRGITQSLNISVSAAICIYEVTQQRSANGNNYAFPSEVQEKLLLDLINR